MDFFGLGPLEILVILVVALLIFGPHKLPEIGSQLGRAMREFRKATSSLSRDLTKELMQQPPEQKRKPGGSQPTVETPDEKDR